MTTAKLDSKFSTQVGDVLAPHVDPLMAKLRAGKVDTLHVIGTLVPSERTEPTPGEDKEASVKLRLVTAEIPSGDQSEVLREVQRALWLVRTATGTITEEGDIQVAKHTLQSAGGQVAYIAAARLRAGVDQWAKQARAATTARLSGQEMWHEMGRIADGLQALLSGADPDGDDQLDLDDAA
jgi:hypothetical protein